MPRPKAKPIDRSTLPHHLGKCWLDMPGESQDAKRMNFALFKRGKISADYVSGSDQTRAKLNMQTDYRRRTTASPR